MNELETFYKNALIGSLCEPLCDEYKGKWRACNGDKERLISLSMNQQAIPYFATYCRMGKGVSKDYILREFGEYINGYTIENADDIKGYTYSLYVDYDHDKDLVVDKDVAHIMWTVGASVVIPQTKCPTIYVSNRSDVHIVCEGFNHFTLYLFDNSRVVLEELGEESYVLAYKYGSNCELIKGKYCLGNVKEHNKELRL